MNQSFATVTRLAVISSIGAIALIGCEPDIVKTDTIENALLSASVSEDESVEPVEFTSVRVRFLGVDEDEIEGPSSDSFRELGGGAISGPTLQGPCSSDEQCSEGFTCALPGTDIKGDDAEGRCYQSAITQIEELDCGIYDVQLETIFGSCNLVLEESEEGQFLQYRGEGRYLCFTEGRWVLDSNWINNRSCPEIFEEGRQAL